MKGLLFIGFLVISLISYSQENVEAKNILQKVGEKTKSYSTITADFVFSMVNEQEGIDEKNEGAIKIKGDKYFIELKDIGLEIFSNGQTVWNYMKDGNQVTISSTDDGSGEEFLNPSTIFDIHNQGFICRSLKEVNKADGEYYEIGLIPEDDMNEYSKVTVLVKKDDLIVHNISMLGIDENTYIVDIKNLKPNLQIEESKFIFNEKNYPDIEVVDFR